MTEAFHDEWRIPLTYLLFFAMSYANLYIIDKLGKTYYLRARRS